MTSCRPAPEKSLSCGSRNVIILPGGTGGRMMDRSIGRSWVRSRSHIHGREWRLTGRVRRSPGNMSGIIRRTTQPWMGSLSRAWAASIQREREPQAIELTCRPQRETPGKRSCLRDLRYSVQYVQVGRRARMPPSFDILYMYAVEEDPSVSSWSHYSICQYS